jgi:hypothetical protein
MRIFTMTALFVFAFTTYAAGGPKPNNKAKPDAEELMQQILQLNSDLSCQRTEDCTAVALGARSCGGPAGYLVVSKRNPKYEKIVERAKLHEAISKENLVLKGGNTMGTCNVIMPTTTVCDRKKCIEAPL